MDMRTFHKNPIPGHTTTPAHRSDSQSNHPVNPNHQVQAGLTELIGLLKTFINQNMEEKTKPKEKIKNQSSHYEIQPRNRHVLIPLPNVQPSKLSENDHKEVKLWIAEVAKTVFSSAFYYYSKGEMSFQQTKIFCSQNILKNMSVLNNQHALSAQQFQVIDKHLVKRVLPYLGMKYPLSDSAEINKKLSSLVQEIDNIEEIENNYFTTSKICFQYRKEGNYYDIIMKVINDLLNRIDELGQSGKTNYQQFEKFMTKLFEKVYDYQWMTKNQQLQLAFLGECIKYLDPQHAENAPTNSLASFFLPSAVNFNKPKIKRKDRGESIEKPKEGGQQKEKQRDDRKDERKKKEEQQKYKVSVKQYTSFLIGRKIPQNVPLFNDEQISQNKISIKHPTILRILTKWFEQLWKKFQKNYFSNRSQSIKLQRGENIHDLKPQYRRNIDKLMGDQKKKINFYIKNIQKLNYKLQSSILKIQKQFQGENQMDQLQRICGKFAYKVVRNLHKEIIQYLNKVIHSILLVSKRFHEYVLDPQRNNQSEKSNWPFPPNLISFKVGDLMRCKFSSKEQEIIKIYNQILQINQMKQYNKKFKIVRIKNRLKDSTNDILINVRFNQEILCEIQLAIKSHASDFIKASNAFHHYIYQLQRSQFGPLTELCSIWMSFDGRARIYQNLILSEVKKQDEDEVEVQKSACRCWQYMADIKTQQPFICDKCNQIYLHNNYIIKHRKCYNCNDCFMCAKCRIFDQEFQVLKSKLILNRLEKDSKITNKKLLRDSCMRLINKDWASFQNQNLKYGLCIFIQSNRIKIKTFKLVTYNNKKYLLGLKDNDQFYQIGDISDLYFQRQFQSRNILIQIKQHEDILKFDDLKAIKQYVLPLLARQVYKKYKESIVLHIKTNDYKQKKLNNRDCSNILMSGLKPQRERIKNVFASDNKLTELPCQYDDFPNMEWLVLSRNPISSLQGLQKFKYLRIFVMQNSVKDSVNIPSVLLKFVDFQFLQKLVLSYFKIGQIPPQFKNLRRLKCLQLEHCQLNSINHICKCQALQKLNVSNNAITNIPQELIKFEKLQTFILHKNPIQFQSTQTYLPDLSQKMDVYLINLDLSNCQLKKLSLKFSALTNLQSFNLQKNQFQHIQSQVFSFMDQLKILNLSYNKLKAIPDLSGCTKLNSLSIKFNRIQQLPQFLSNLPVQQFKFQGCPIKKIECIQWLKNTLDQTSCILQKFHYWFEKIPALNHTSHDTKYVTRLINQDESSQATNSDQNQWEDEAILEDIRLAERSSSKFIQESQSESSEGSSMKSSKQKYPKSHKSGMEKTDSHTSNHFTHFFSMKKRASLHSNDYSDSQSNDQLGEQKNYGKEQCQTLQSQLQMEDIKCAQRLTLQKLNSYFSHEEMLVFDFQSRIKYSQDTTAFEKLFNLYHDQNHPEISLKFIDMMAKEGIAHSILNIFTGRFSQNVQKHAEIRFDGKEDRSQLIYNDLRKDRIPFSYTATVYQGKKMEIRNIATEQMPTHLLHDKLQKLVIYKIKSIPISIIRCGFLKQLKIRKSRLPALPPTLGQLKMLERLDLTKNWIETIDGHMFAQMKELKVLILSQNKLKEVPVLNNCTQLQKLYLSDNLIEVIPRQLSSLSHLQTFQFSNCPVKSIQCRQWLIQIMDPDQAVLQECHLYLCKMHYSSKLTYQKHFIAHKLFKWNDNDKTQYQPYDEVEEQKYVNFFHHNFREEEILRRFTDNEFLAFKFISKTKYERDRITSSNQFNVIVDKDHPDGINKFKNFLQHYMLSTTKLTSSQIEFIQLPTITKPQCSSCHKLLTYPFYWLKWEQNGHEHSRSWMEKHQYGCRTCIQAKGANDQEYAYKNNSVLLVHKNDSKKMPADTVGKNLQPKFVTNASKHIFQCNGCGQSDFKLGEARYLCLGCKTSNSQEKAADLLDLCGKCLNKMIAKEEKLMKTLEGSHHKGFHPFLRILYNTQGYYIY